MQSSKIDTNCQQDTQKQNVQQVLDINSKYSSPDHSANQIKTASYPKLQLPNFVPSLSIPKINKEQLANSYLQKVVDEHPKQTKPDLLQPTTRIVRKTVASFVHNTILEIDCQDDDQAGLIPFLQDLHLPDMQITSFSIFNFPNQFNPLFVEHLPRSITKISLPFNKIESLQQFDKAQLPNLTNLQLYSNNIKLLEGLQQLQSIKILNVAANKLYTIDSIKIVSQLKNLLDFNVSKNKVVKLNDFDQFATNIGLGVKKLNGLSVIMIRQNNIQLVNISKVISQLNVAIINYRRCNETRIQKLLNVRKIASILQNLSIHIQEMSIFE